MTTQVTVTYPDGTTARNSFYAGMQDIGAAWDWIARTVAERSECSPDDVGCDDAPEGEGDAVTVHGVEVARCALAFVYSC